MTDQRYLHATEEFNRFAEHAGAQGRCDPSLSFSAPELHRVLAIWREKAAGRTMPLRIDMNARTLSPFLPHVIIVDVVESSDERRFRLRLMGTTITRMLGDHTGQFVDEAFASPFRERWAVAIGTALDAGGPIRLSGRLEYKAHDFVETEFLLAPVEPCAGSAEAVLIVAYAKYSARHVFEPLVRNTVSMSSGKQNAARMSFAT
jgi:hypothetical protein